MSRTSRRGGDTPAAHGLAAGTGVGPRTHPGARERRGGWGERALAWLSRTLVVLGMVLVGGSAFAQPTGQTVVLGNIDGLINPVMAGYVTRVIDDAERTNASAVVFQMDTPGGLSDSMRQINGRILASRVPVIVYVAPGGARAGSAGVYIAYAAHLAAMAPATNIGSATPVALGEGGEQQLSDEMRNKLTNDAVAQIRALAEQRGRDADFAERAVREGANLQASEALRQNVVNYIAADVRDLLRQMDGARVQLPDGEVTLRTADAETRPAELSAVERFLLTITNPTIAYLLLSLGSLGLVLELYNPGSVYPGVAGGISLLLALYALGTLPVNLAGVGLIAFGLFLVALEPFVASAGVLAIGGVIAFVMGSLLLFDAPESAPFLSVSLGAIVAMAGVLLLFSLLAGVAVLRSRGRQVVTGREGLLGARGVVRTAIPDRGEGAVLVQGELWRAQSRGGTLPAGTRVRVQQVDGLTVFVATDGQEQTSQPGRP